MALEVPEDSEAAAEAVSVVALTKALAVVAVQVVVARTLAHLHQGMLVDKVALPIQVLGVTLAAEVAEMRLGTQAHTGQVAVAVVAAVAPATPVATVEQLGTLTALATRRHRVEVAEDQQEQQEQQERQDQQEQQERMLLVMRS